MNTGVIQVGCIQRGEEEGSENAEKKPLWDLSGAIISAAIEVHELLGPGLLESIYGAALFHELRLRGIKAEQQLEVPVFYKNVALTQALRLDLLVDGLIIVELKSVEAVLPVHKAQLLSHLRLTRCQLGLLINFNTPQLRHGIYRVVNSRPDKPTSSAFSSSPR